MKDLKVCKFCSKEYNGRGAMFCSHYCKNKAKIMLTGFVTPCKISTSSRQE